MEKCIKLRKNEQGIALVTVLLVLTVISLLGLTIMGFALNNVKLSSSERTYQSAYYIAESGITYTMDKITKNIIDIYNNSNNESDFFSKIESMISTINKEPPYKSFENSFGYAPEAKISIEKVDYSSVTFQDYKIISTGTINNRSRTVEKQIQVNWVPKNNITIPDTAVFVKEIISLSGGAKILGGAGTNSSIDGSIALDGGAGISDKIYVGPQSGNSVINKPKWMTLNNEIVKLQTVKTFDMPPFPAFPSNPIPPNEKIQKDGSTYYVINNGALRIDDYKADNYTLNLTKDLQFTEIYISSNYTLNINLGNNNRNIVVNSLNIPNGKINIIGTGKLTIYVNTNITMGAGSKINAINSNNSNSIKAQIKTLDIYYKGSHLNLAGDQKIYGSLYALNADISMSGGSGFQGYIITGGKMIDISGGANAITQLFYAPNADVNMSGGGNIKGSIICKTYTGSGGSTITLDNFDATDLPPNMGGTTGGPLSAKDIISVQPSREK
ncbi:DUF7305 domain-containing protein [Fictibacillus gelatini]|uniref:DUF7305 domain-containing protein n=1 Tax=Fictibacillus gelatini TaxID=225985 RepID=UPI0003F8A0D9|nr:PilX N-terminal domain-containing pilus assembly protein [Fictibacillus gelatini]